MTDRELLEAAAKAVGIEINWVRNSGCYYYENPETGHEIFDPLTDDGDALRLAVKLGIEVTPFNTSKVTRSRVLRSIDSDICEAHEGDPYAATRRAIVRAAAEIGAKA